jgi:hypothetical protein
MMPAGVYLPQRGTISDLYLPRPFHVPEDALLRAIGFNFTGVGPLQTAYQAVQVFPSFLAWALVGIDDQAGSIGFQVQFWHNTPSGQRQFFATSVLSGTVCGLASNPMYITEPELFASGDAIRCQVKNLSTTLNDDIYVALWGGDVNV